jgi:hypothetical protein
MQINVSLSSAEEMTKILTKFSKGINIKREEIMNFLNQDEGCRMQFKFYEDEIDKDDYVDMLYAVVKESRYETENFILKRMYEALKNIYSNLELLYKKLDNVKCFNLKGFEDRLVSTLPLDTKLKLNIFFCLDGYNGGSIVDDNTMCLDVLFWPSKKELEKNIEGVVLHEFHHIGFLYWLKKNVRRNELVKNKDKISLAINLVEGILSEGAAVYFFNKDQDLYELLLEGYGEELAKGFKGGYLESWNNLDEKISDFNNIMLQLLDGTADNYNLLDDATEKYFYMTKDEEALNKVIGKYMCSVIEEVLGRQALIDSFINLQNFLNYYNDACEKSAKQGLDKDMLYKWDKLWQ